MTAVARSRPAPQAVRAFLLVRGRGRRVGTAAFGGGTPAELEAAFAGLHGVLATTVGRVGDTDAVRVEFDPRLVSYEELLDVLAPRALVFTYSREQERLALGAREPASVRPIFPAGGFVW